MQFHFKDLYYISYGIFSYLKGILYIRYSLQKSFTERFELSENMQILSIIIHFKTKHTAPSGHDNHHLYKKVRRDPLPLLMQGKTSIVMSSYQEEPHHTGECKVGLPQQTQTAEVGLQSIPI